MASYKVTVKGSEYLSSIPGGSRKVLASDMDTDIDLVLMLQFLGEWNGGRGTSSKAINKNTRMGSRLNTREELLTKLIRLGLVTLNKN